MLYPLFQHARVYGPYLQELSAAKEVELTASEEVKLAMDEVEVLAFEDDSARFSTRSAGTTALAASDEKAMRQRPAYCWNFMLSVWLCNHSPFKERLYPNEKECTE